MTESMVLENQEVTQLLYHNRRFKTEEWFQLPPIPEDMGLGSAACTFGDDIYVAGGKNTMAAFFQFETRKNAWVKLAPLNMGRRNHVHVAIGNRLYVLGGLNNEVTTLSSVECYDISKAQWTDVGNLHTAVRSSGSAVIGIYNTPNFTICIRLQPFENNAIELDVNPLITNPKYLRRGKFIF
ncbi:kelch-like protein 24 [Elysia marginata]|uniref:Kelch-like protein 24 n=1 Tax=Elysia marginata TaxID=1093978 RepID=A0AAV4JVN5_9GAST|nr:kelch-like protein 24 [Elysia marginata]